MNSEKRREEGWARRRALSRHADGGARVLPAERQELKVGHSVEGSAGAELKAPEREPRKEEEPCACDGDVDLVAPPNALVATVHSERRGDQRHDDRHQAADVAHRESDRGNQVLSVLAHLGVVP